MRENLFLMWPCPNFVLMHFLFQFVNALTVPFFRHRSIYISITLKKINYARYNGLKEGRSTVYSIDYKKKRSIDKSIDKVGWIFFTKHRVQENTSHGLQKH